MHGSAWIVIGVLVVLVLVVSVGTHRVANAQDRDEAYADMSNTLGTTDRIVVQGRIVEEDDPVDLTTARPGREASQDELKDVTVQLALIPPKGGDPVDLGSFKTDNEGYLHVALPLERHKLKPGAFTLQVRLDGRSIGSARVRLLAADYDKHVVRSDIDLTWLLTDFHSKRAMAGLLTDRATDRKTLPAMDIVYKALRRGEDGKADRPLVFVSGSPRFFKRTLEGKAQLDGITQDGIILKPFKEIARLKLGALEPEQIVPALEEQVGYKLEALLRTRLGLPASAREILMGDDSEADAVVYNLYHRTLSGDLDDTALAAQLKKLGVGELWSERILTHAPKARAQVNSTSPVDAIYINRTGKPSTRHKAADWSVKNLTLIHDGAWPLALAMLQRGFIDEAAALDVRKRLVKEGASADTLKARADQAIQEGFATQETLDGLGP